MIMLISGSFYRRPFSMLPPKIVIKIVIKIHAGKKKYYLSVQSQKMLMKYRDLSN
jgi:hypothetical protein